MEPRPVFDFVVEGPVQAEIFVLTRRNEAISLTGPCGAAPWMVELGQEDPVEAVTRITKLNIGEPTVVHSTSWRRDRDAVILSFVVVVDPALVEQLDHAPVARTELARSEATHAPAEIAYAQVLEHGLRHLAWLMKDDDVVRRELGDLWAEMLAGYVPEPFRHL
ncbi:MAG: hypothetical protein WD826_08720 [Actinomycetota bacterium]